MKRYLGRKPGGGWLQCRFTAPLRLLSHSPFPALLFSLPRGTKRTWMQQPFWDSVLLNCADCEEAACKQEHRGSIQSGLYSGLSSTPTHWPKKTTNSYYSVPNFLQLINKRSYCDADGRLAGQPHNYTQEKRQEFTAELKSCPEMYISWREISAPNAGPKDLHSTRVILSVQQRGKIC